MSWLYSQVLVEEFLGDTSSDGEQSVPSSGNPIPQAFCAPDKMTDFSRLSRFGMTFKPLTEDLGEELLTLFRGVFPARIFQPLEKGQELMESDQVCGDKWHGSFTKYNPDTCSWKTHQCSLLGDLEEFSETWPQWGLMRDGECWEQRTLEQTIRGTGFGFVPNGVDNFHTPNTTGLDGGSKSRKALKKKQENWPTPDANCGMRGTQDIWTPKRKSGHQAQYSINQAVRDAEKIRWPTPVKSDHAARRPSKGWQGNSDLPSVVWTETGGRENPNLSPAQLNATWVEWLMGWPLGWTDLKPSATDKSHCVPQPHGES